VARSGGGPWRRRGRFSGASRLPYQGELCPVRRRPGRARPGGESFARGTIGWTGVRQAKHDLLWHLAQARSGASRGTRCGGSRERRRRARAGAGRTSCPRHVEEEHGSRRTLWPTRPVGTREMTKLGRRQAGHVAAETSGRPAHLRGRRSRKPQQQTRRPRKTRAPPLPRNASGQQT
jgi:hypothetical protein